MSLLELRNLSRRFDNFIAVDNVSLEIAKGEFFTLLGPSGCGKTTLLRMIAGFDTPDSGQILLDGSDITQLAPEKRPIHTVFQSYALFPHMTVAQNVAFPLQMARVPPSEIRERVQQAIEEVHLSALEQRYPHELSGGQKQRVALARGLINRPRLLLLDEPLGALDAKLREDLQRELIDLQKEVGTTFIFVTHSQDEALALSQRIAVMNQGRVEQIDEPSVIYSRPASRFVADFVGRTNLLDAQVTQLTEKTMTLQMGSLGAISLPANNNVKVDDWGVIAIRPEQISVHKTSEQIEAAHEFVGKVLNLFYVGDVTSYVVELKNGAHLEAMLANTTPGVVRFFEIGDSVTVTWPTAAAQFLKE